MNDVLATDRDFALHNEEKGKLIAQLIAANKELAFQNEEKEKRSAELIHAKELYEFLSQINQTIVHSKDQQTVFREACRIATGFGKFKAAWISTFDSENKFNLIESSGMSDEDTALFTKIRYENSGPIGKVMQTGNFYLCNDIENDPVLVNWRSLAVERGWHSCMALPVRHQNVVVAIFIVVSAGKKIFESQEVSLLVEAADDISFALDIFEKEQHRREIERTLVTTNKELAFQNSEKEKRAAELLIANKELAFQNQDKEKLALELIIANKQLAFESAEKGQRAIELTAANKELAFQNREKEKRAAELLAVNQELLNFTYISNHDLQEPLRKIQVFISRIVGSDSETLSPTGKSHLQRIQHSAERMQQLIRDLLLYHYVNNAEYKFEKIDLALIVKKVKEDLAIAIEEKNAIVEFNDSCFVDTMFVSFRQLLYNIIHNALKFAKPDVPPHIVINASIVTGSELNIDAVSVGKQYCHIAIKDNGIGFDPESSERIFEVFYRLHGKDEYPGTGVGLAIARKIVARHNGVITATSEPGKGSAIDIYIPQQ